MDINPDLSPNIQDALKRRAGGAHTPNNIEPTVQGLTVRTWQAVAEIAGKTCHANGGSKSMPCDECLSAAEHLLRNCQRTLRT